MDLGGKKHSSVKAVNNTDPVIVDPQSLPRITPELTLVQLKDECRARCIRQGSNKLDLLTSLQIGTVHLSALREYGFLESVKKIMEVENSSRRKEFQDNLRQYVDHKATKENEKIGKENEKRVKLKIGREDEMKTQLVLHISIFTIVKTIHPACVTGIYASAALIEIEKYRLSKRCMTDGALATLAWYVPCKLSCLKCHWDICNRCIVRSEEEVEQQKRQQAERAANKAKHTISHNFHDCLLAKTSELLQSNGRPRSSGDPLHNSSSCSWKGCIDTRAAKVVLTCQDCNFDICAACVKIATKLNKKRKRDEDIIESSAQEVFANKIKNPPAANVNSASLKAFVVWTSCGYTNDRWHSYNPEPVKKFDSSFDTADEANLRARFVFYYKNVWGIAKEEMDFEVKETTVGDLVTFVTHPPDDERYTVAAVKKEVFEYFRGVMMKDGGGDDVDEDEDEQPNPYHLSEESAWIL
eukprot:gene28647-37628_t